MPYMNIILNAIASVSILTIIGLLLYLWLNRNPATKSKLPILSVDFDGVIHSYRSGWQGVAVIADPPTHGAIRWLMEMSNHFDVCIFSSRSSTFAGRRAMRNWLWRELLAELHGDSKDLIEHMAGHDVATYASAWFARIRFQTFKPSAFLTIDDRAIEFNGRFAHLTPERLLEFRPWNKRRGPTGPRTKKATQESLPLVEENTTPRVDGRTVTAATSRLTPDMVKVNEMMLAEFRDVLDDPAARTMATTMFVEKVKHRYGNSAPDADALMVVARECAEIARAELRDKGASS